MKLAVFDTKSEAERYQEFVDNLAIRGTEYGFYIETYASIPHGSCHYAQTYSLNKPSNPTNVTDKAEAIQRFTKFYWRMNQSDNEV